MVDKNTMVYGGGSGLLVVAGVVVGVFTTWLAGGAVIAVGVFLGLGYSEFIEPRTKWLEAKPRKALPESVGAETQILRREEREVAAAEGIIAKVLGALKGAGESIQVVCTRIKLAREAKRKTEEALKKLEHEIVSRVKPQIKKLEKSRDQLATEVKEMEERKTELSGHQKLLEDNRKRCEAALKDDALKGKDRERKETQLQELSRLIEEIKITLDSDIKDKAESDLARVSTWFTDISQLGTEIEMTREQIDHELSDAATPKRGVTYKDTVTSFDNMHRLRGKLTAQVRRHVKLVNLVAGGMDNLQQLALELLRLEQQAKAEVALAKVVEADRRIHSLEQRRAELEGEIQHLETTVSGLETERDEVNKKLATWQADLEAARKEVDKADKKKKSALKSVIGDVLSRNVEEGSSILLDLVRKMQQQEKLAGATKSRAETAEQQLTESKAKVTELMTARQELITQRNAALKEVEQLNETMTELETERAEAATLFTESIDKLKAEQAESEKAIKKATEDSLKQEHEANIEQIRQQIKEDEAEYKRRLEEIDRQRKEANTQKAAAEAARQTAESELSTTEGTLANATTELEKARAQMPKLKQDASDAQSAVMLLSTLVTNVEKEKEKETKELAEHIELLEGEYHRLYEGMQERDKKSIILRHKADLAEKEAKRLSEEAGKALEEQRKAERLSGEAGKELEEKGVSSEEKEKRYKAVMKKLVTQRDEARRTRTAIEEQLAQQREEASQARTAIGEQLAEQAAAATQAQEQLSDLRASRHAALEAAQDQVSRLREANGQIDGKLRKAAQELAALQKEEKEIPKKTEDTAAKDRLRNIARMIKEREGKISSLKETLSETRSALSTKTGEAKTAQEQLTKTQGELNDTETRLKQAELDLENWIDLRKDEIAETTQKIDVLKGKVTASTTELESSKARAKQLMEYVFRLSHIIAGENKAVLEAKKIIESKDLKEIELHERRQEMQLKIDEMQVHIEDRDQRLVELNSLWKDEMGVTDQLSDNLGEVEEEYDALGRAYAELQAGSESQAEELKKDLTNVQVQLERQTGTVNRLSPEVERLKKREADLLKSVNDLEQALEGVRKTAARVTEEEAKAQGLDEQLEQMQAELEQARTSLGERKIELETATGHMHDAQTRSKHLEEVVIPDLKKTARDTETSAQQAEQKAQDAETQAKEEEQEKLRLLRILEFNNILQGTLSKIVASKHLESQVAIEILTVALDELHTLKQGGELAKKVPFTPEELESLDKWVQVVETMIAEAAPMMEPDPEGTIKYEGLPIPAREPEPEGTIKYEGLPIPAHKPEPEPEPKLPPIIAIGDIHGDFDVLVTVLQQAGVIDEHRNWAIKGQPTKVIMMGDYMDRGPHTFDVLDLIWYLKEQAGDQLTLLIGNHEAMFMGSFDWVGFDESSEGRSVLNKYLTQRQDFDVKLIQALSDQGQTIDASEKDAFIQKQIRHIESKGTPMTESQKDQLEMIAENKVRKPEDIEAAGYKAYSMAAFEVWDHVLQAQNREFIKLYLRLEALKIVWANNDKGMVFSNLNLNFMDVFKDSKLMLNKDHVTNMGKSVRDYLKFLRENLETYHYDNDNGILFVHAGVPYKARIEGLPEESQSYLETINMSLKRVFKRFVTESEFHATLEAVNRAIKKRDLQMWIAFTEKSPLFASHPNDRSLEWDKIPEFTEEMIKLEFGFNAIVFGHARHNPFKAVRGYPAPEADMHHRYEGGAHKYLRREFNIDFGMSRAYGMSHGGWLSVNKDGSVTTTLLSQTGDAKNPYERLDYTYHCKAPSKTKTV